MTIATTTSKLLYNGDGVTASFPIPFVFWDSADLRVILRDAAGAESVWTEGTHYTVSGGGGATGTLTVATAPVDHTPAAGETLLIKSAIAELQQAALPLGGAFPSTTVERMADIATRLVQQHSEEIARSILLPETTALSGLRIPEPGGGALLRYNAAGTDLETVALGDLSTAIDTLLSGLADQDLLVWDAAQGVWANTRTIAASLALEDADAGAGAGPVLTLDRKSASPAAADLLGALRLRGRNDAAGAVDYAAIAAEIADPSGGAEDGGLALDTTVAGALATRLRLRQGLYAAGALGGDRGADTVNAAAFHVHGSLLLPRGHIDGLTLSNNGADPDHDVDIAAGEAVDGGQAAMMALAATLTKRIDASWAAGSGAGGLDGSEAVAGTPDADTWYHVWLIRRADTGAVDALFSESATAPTLPTGYAQKRRIGAVLTDASANIVGFSQFGDEFLWNVPVRDYNVTNPGTSAVLRVLTVPVGARVYAIHSVASTDTSAGSPVRVLVTSPDQADTAPSAAAFSLYQMWHNAGAAQGGDVLFGGRGIRTNTLAQIRVRQDYSDAAIVLYGITHGWLDPRGRNT